jgi:hypothetical protein
MQFRDIFIEASVSARLFGSPSPFNGVVAGRFAFPVCWGCDRFGFSGFYLPATASQRAFLPVGDPSLHTKRHKRIRTDLVPLWVVYLLVIVYITYLQFIFCIWWFYA